METVLQVERETGCRVFTLNRPQRRNALSAELVEALIAELQQALDDDVALLVFRGEGKNFSAGFDFTGYEDESEGDLLLRLVRIQTLLDMVATAPCATLGLAHGRNFGAGADLFAACQQRVCAPDASFRMPGLNFGLVLGTRRFGRIAGREQALRILSQTQEFDAGNAVEIGFAASCAEQKDWRDVIGRASDAASMLDASARRQLHRALLDDAQGYGSDRDMALMVRSAARPGLKVRIAGYLQASRR
ncbi:MAG: enoyl-CoA hydratase/isomerase family protein [Pusillimonas sp.]